MRKRRVVVLYGGKADEHSISCISTAGVLKAMDTERFEPVPVGITKAGEWVMGGTDPRDFDVADGAMPTVAGPDADDAVKPVVLDMSRGNNGFYARQKDGTLTSLGYVDAVFPVLHGPYGEDGTVQGLLEMMGVPYVGCGVFASAACMDKAFTKVILSQAGIPVAPGVTVDTRDFAGLGGVGSSQAERDADEASVSSALSSASASARDALKSVLPTFLKDSDDSTSMQEDQSKSVAPESSEDTNTSSSVGAGNESKSVPPAFVEGAKAVMKRIKAAKLRYPLFVKPSRSGSSFGVTKLERVGDADELAAALFEASHHDWKVLVEQGIDGREIECAVLAPKAEDEPKSALPGEIVLDHRAEGDDQFYDFDSKYTDSDASHVEVPASLPAETLKRAQDVAVRAFKAVDGAGLSRVDTFVTRRGEVMVNEINTMPGFTPISMYPKAWEASGVSYTELITRLIEGVLR
ncbi:D-alanine--D-alanine ligase [Bifidobacterium sp. ESL0775]|uniref:D-alanine--D-alanine ligase family protein n=1 Tax=Bifidobacterium sp. ESL0775 TaxID=2983230 RepID=UPI0023F98191|nr:D-alanine--D-alanine ligase family protein [Bifidobacterium sp. ESL0775]WEV69605.1 D-alanine--D-alanine ligase [Bifidobacterium sp. ESL0775]